MVPPSVGGRCGISERLICHLRQVNIDGTNESGSTRPLTPGKERPRQNGASWYVQRRHIAWHGRGVWWPRHAVRVPDGATQRLLHKESPARLRGEKLERRTGPTLVLVGSGPQEKARREAGRGNLVQLGSQPGF